MEIIINILIEDIVTIYFLRRNKMSGRLLIKIMFNLGLGVICSLLVWELILSAFVEKSPGTTQHPILGRIYKSNGTYVNGTEGFSRTRFNSQGMRNAEIQDKKKEEFRIIILGDSYTEGVQVNDQETFSSLLNKKLNDDYIKKTSVINAGRSGASPADYIHLADFYNELKPDYVVVQVNDNDFKIDMLNENKPFTVIKSNSKFKTNHNVDFGSTNPLTQKFPQLEPITEISTVRVGFKKIQQLLNSNSDSTAVEDSSQISNKKKEQDNLEELISFSVKQLKEKYPNLVLLYLPDINYSELNAKDTEIASLLKKYSRMYSVDIIDMKEDFMNSYKNTNQPVHGFNNTIPGEGHINNVGHQLVSDKLIHFFEWEANK